LASASASISISTWAIVFWENGKKERLETKIRREKEKERKKERIKSKWILKEIQN